MTQHLDSDMRTWPIERGTAPGSGMQVARIDTPYGWFMVTPAEKISDLDMRMMAAVFCSCYDETLEAHKPQRQETGL